MESIYEICLNKDMFSCSAFFPENLIREPQAHTHHLAINNMTVMYCSCFPCTRFYTVSIIATFLELKCVLTYSTSYGQLLGEYKISLIFFSEFFMSKNENGWLGYQYVTAVVSRH
jgi:hypothetical protein